MHKKLINTYVSGPLSYSAGVPMARPTVVKIQEYFLSVLVVDVILMFLTDIVFSLSSVLARGVGVQVEVLIG